MSSTNLQCFTEERKSTKETHAPTQIHTKILDEKMIASVQVCIRCGRKFSLKRGRKNCPKCQGTLRTETIILKVP